MENPAPWSVAVQFPSQPLSVILTGSLVLYAFTRALIFEFAIATRCSHPVVSPVNPSGRIGDIGTVTVVLQSI